MVKKNILIVDDEQLIVKRVKTILEEYADTVFTAYNGLEALEILKKEEIYCVISDINMPKMNGVELIKKIRAQGNEVPFIFYTGHGNRDLMMEAIKYGAFDFLNKPDLDGLEEVVSRGIKEGLERKKGGPVPSDAYISEYQRLLKDLD